MSILSEHGAQKQYAYHTCISMTFRALLDIILSMKHICMLISLCLLLCACAKPAQQSENTYENTDFTAAVISDLHYTSTPGEFNSIVALEPLGKEVTDALIAQVIDLGCDALILTGDNTNNGKEEDVKELAAKLSKVKDAGIEVIMTTGNHDYGAGSMEPYKQYFLPLLQMDEKDEASFSYMHKTHGVTVFAMDDSRSKDSLGAFEESTMNWLSSLLKKTSGSPVLFLSHHNVLAGIEAPMYRSYLIQNENLVQTLKDAGVRLCMSGHQHNQAIYEHEGMYEILSGMPFSSAHTFGILTIDEEGVRYKTAEIDLETYGEEGLAEKADEYIERQSEAFNATFVRLCEEKGVKEEDEKEILALITRFFDASSRGILKQEAADLHNDPAYAKMQEVLGDKNYGPWIEELLKNPPMDGSSLQFHW